MQKVFGLISLMSLIFLSTPLRADDILEINRSFIEKYKNRLTISTRYTVDAAHKRPNPASKDGDMHVAGRAPEIGLATVAEIQNAKSVPDAVAAIKEIEGSGRSIDLSGVWRIWPEHGGDNTHIQQSDAGAPYEGDTPTNPPHVFEVHPILKIAEQDLIATLQPIDGYEAKEAEEAFPRYERSSFEITPSEDRVRLRMRMIGFNYVKFTLKLRKRFHREQDGEFVSAAIYSEKEGDQELLVHDRRVGFVAGTAPDEKQKSLKVGDCMLVLGIPRVDLALVSWRIRHGGDALRWSMPYEIIAVGIYSDEPTRCGD
ncbi:hypothetical protein QA641_35530 [Bradyrhizobium sp. CB1650]|uniref:hypothetical protein n=1 Tax=Bradyrhizobium sp. CB1650 TaxID=3039153 RepID=UPI002436112E|nr:hypothetical protein [Bradyrhizobium sp. CB1650]WGD50849.1 hypothetical protein QA641_35530 [Bradyrhizobium sp. CB1650]